MAVEYGSLPFEEQIAFFKDKLKNLIPTEKWTDVWRDAHDSGFMVAGAMKADLLADLHGAVLSGIEQGTTLAQFRKDFKEIVARRGWTGWTGEGTKEGAAWRTRVIYDTNMYSSYAAGRYAQATDPEIVDRRPYWRYRHNDSVTHPRPLHVSWNGLVLRHDDPWWNSHFPPNGWGCKCYFETLRKVPDGARTQAPDDGEYVWRGETIPKGIDPGWDYTPGATTAAQIRNAVLEKTEVLPAAIGRALRDDITGVGGGNSPAEIQNNIDNMKVKDFENVTEFQKAMKEQIIARTKAEMNQILSLPDGATMPDGRTMMDRRRERYNNELKENISKLEAMPASNVIGLFRKKSATFDDNVM